MPIFIEIEAFLNIATILGAAVGTTLSVLESINVAVFSYVLKNSGWSQVVS